MSDRQKTERKRLTSRSYAPFVFLLELQVHHAAKRFYFPSANRNIRLAVVVHLDQVRVVEPGNDFFDLAQIQNIVPVASEKMTGAV